MPGKIEKMPTNLLHYCTEFVGREEEIPRVQLTITGHRLVALLGPGGIGKTRLALEVGANMQDAFPDGVWLIEFAALTDPAAVPPWVAAMLRLREQPQLTPLAALIDN